MSAQVAVAKYRRPGSFNYRNSSWFPMRALSWVADGCLLPVSSRGLTLSEKRETEIPGVLLL